MVKERIAKHRAAALEFGCRRPKPGSKRIAQDLEDLIDPRLRRDYQVCGRSSFLRIWREIRAECEAEGFQPPIRKTVKARLDAMDQRDVRRNLTRPSSRRTSDWDRHGGCSCAARDTQSTIAKKGDYDSEKHAALTLAKFDDGCIIAARYRV